MLNVERVHVQLVFGLGANLLLDEIHIRYRAAADVVMHAAPFHGRPIANRYSRNYQGFRRVAARPNQLPEGLRAIEQTLAGARADDDARFFGKHYVALLVKIFRDVELGSFESR